MSDGIPLTAQQRAAISRRGVSIALSAGAGCGKTFVLTQRYLSHLEPNQPGGIPPADLSELVAITFTERAAREMRDRIRQACQQRLEAADASQAAHWQNILRNLHNARISTIHSFCGGLLRSHFVQARLDPRFRTLDQTQSQALLMQVLDDMLRRWLGSRDAAILDLFEQFDLKALREMVSDLVAQRQRIDLAAWQTRTVDDILAAWQRFHQDEFLATVRRQLIEELRSPQMLPVLREFEPPDAVLGPRREIVLAGIGRLMQQPPEALEPRALRELLEEIRKNTLLTGQGVKRAWTKAHGAEEYKAALQGIRDLLDETTPLVEFDAVAARPAALASLQFLRLAREAIQEYDRRKLELGALDFEDLLIRTRELLVDPAHRPLRQQLAGSIREILVDEMQDTDPLQANLIAAICDNEIAGGKLFFVGDLKQSIYRFRLADPMVFRRFREKIPPAGRLPLTLNFRSQPQILAFVNALFCEQLEEDYEPLKANRPQVTRPPVIEFMWASAPPDEQQEVAGPSSRPGRTAEKADELRAREADWIARRVYQMLNSGEKIVAGKPRQGEEPTARPVRPGDIAVLFRALSEVAVYETALQRYGIEYYLVGGHAFYAQQEIFDLLNLLRSLDGARDDVSLAGALRSPLLAIEDSTLFWLARQPRGLWHSVFIADELPPELDARQQARVQFARKTLRHLRSIKDRVAITELFGEVFRCTGYDALLLTEFLGERKLANVLKLVEQARGFDASSQFTLADFVAELTEFVARDPKEPLAATLPETMDVVRLMTIHQAKGLEFPVVIVPDLERMQPGNTRKATFHSELGALVKFPEAEAPGAVDYHAWLERQADEAESIRLFYVVTTRAADYLILSAGVKSLGKAGALWTKTLAARFDLLSGQLAAELPPEFEAPRIRVTTTEPPVPEIRHDQPRRGLDRLLKETRQLIDRGTATCPLDWKPLGVAAATRREFSFSRLHDTLDFDEPAQQLDAEAAGPASLDPLVLGTLVHAALERVRFGEPVDVPGLVDRLAEAHLSGERAQDKALAIDLVSRFLQSETARKLAAAQKVHRELEFLLAWPPDASDSEKYLRGVIDCLYQDLSGHWHVLDYKTNLVDDATLQATAERYRMQMLCYALAVEKINGTPPASLQLYFMRTGKTYSFPWNAAARRQVVTMVNEAIEKYVVEESQVGG
jgi:ATP-dependent helicase/nuclease subunit A